VPKTSRRLLDEYLSANLPKDGVREEFSEVTVEMEEPLQLATVSVSAQTHGNSDGTQEMTASQESSATAIETDPNNRRSQTRYSCRVSAEVYRTGTSVPNHCCLTDLSAGGCYLEISLPFPQGSTVEIFVRTHELKLRLLGTVQAAHPGYGMGIAFESRTKEQQNNVAKLTDFVEATQANNN
jgi:hypothetical protein